MSFKCSDLLPLLWRGPCVPIERYEKFEPVDWVGLCPESGQLWSVGELDKYEVQSAVKIHDQERWHHL
jgi:hypothetical protein